MKKSTKTIIICFSLILLVIAYFAVAKFINNDKLLKSNEVNNKSLLIEERVPDIKPINVILNDNLKIEINSKVTKNSLIKEVKNGQIVSNNELIDSSSLGIKTVTIDILNLNKKIEKYQFKIEVIDTTKPNINAQKELSTFVNEKIDLTKGVEVSDNSEEKINIEIKGTYDFNKVGIYNLQYFAKDSSGNEAQVSFVLKVNEKPKENNDDKELENNKITKNGFKIENINGVTYIDGILIVNKSYMLPSNYGTMLTKETKDAFNLMQADALAIGLNLYISSGFRSYDTQNDLYNYYLKKDGLEKADTYSARPGYSEHQSGLAIDLNTVDDKFANTIEGKWIKEHCYIYGFILRYPEEKEDITGYKYEPWHLRYVGVDLATKLYNNGNWLTLEEYFGIDSKYN